MDGMFLRLRLRLRVSVALPLRVRVSLSLLCLRLRLCGAGQLTSAPPPVPPAARGPRLTRLRRCSSRRLWRGSFPLSRCVSCLLDLTSLALTVVSQNLCLMSYVLGHAIMQRPDPLSS
eukprot:492326-Rhodomonas_salina.5